MTENVSGYGLVAALIATTTFPAGVTITQFADNADPADMAAVKIADTALGLNGDLIWWSRAVTLPVVLSVIPGSDDDVNLSILAEANRVGQGKLSAQDDITLALIYPDGTNITYSGGKLTDAPFGKSVSSEGRLKSKIYTFSFQNKVGA